MKTIKSYLTSRKPADDPYLVNMAVSGLLSDITTLVENVVQDLNTGRTSKCTPQLERVRELMKAAKVLLDNAKFI